jgi:hypothetical protein
MLRAVETAPTHSEVRIDGPSTKDEGSKLLLPLPRISVLTGCRVLARAHAFMPVGDI